jgi:hypothetical protein
MKNINKISVIAFVVLMLICAKLNTVFAIENKYTNQLLKLSVDKSANNKVNLTVITTNPYKIKINPIKRSDNEYVIFLPETYHSITAKPDISAVNDVQDVDVKLIPYIGAQNNNGYTKIVIKTKSADTKLNINNTVMSQESKNNSELSRLISKNTVKSVSGKNNSAVKTLSVNKAENVVKTKKLDSNKSPVVDKIKNINEEIVSQRNIVSTPKTSYSSPSPVLTAQQVSEKTIAENKFVNKSLTEELKNIPPVPTVTATKNSFPQKIKQITNKVKRNDTTLKIVLVSLIAFLALFIIVIRYFKSMLMRQMKMAEAKAIASKVKSPLPKKIQKSPVNGTYKQVSSNINDSAKQNINNPESNIKVIKGFEIEGNKGFYLIQTKYNRVLIGTINSEVFLLKEFGNIQNPMLVIRKEKSLKTKNVYYVQVNDWRALVSTASDNIKLELVLDKILVAR